MGLIPPRAVVLFGRSARREPARQSANRQVEALEGSGSVVLHDQMFALPTEEGLHAAHEAPFGVRCTPPTRRDSDCVFGAGPMRTLRATIGRYM